MRVICQSLADTLQLGQRLGQALRGGEFEEKYLLLRIKFHVSPLGFSRWGGPKWSTDRYE